MTRDKKKEKEKSRRDKYWRGSWKLNCVSFQLSRWFLLAALSAPSLSWAHYGAAASGWERALCNCLLELNTRLARRVKWQLARRLGCRRREGRRRSLAVTWSCSGREAWGGGGGGRRGSSVFDLTCGAAWTVSLVLLLPLLLLLLLPVLGCWGWCTVTTLMPPAGVSTLTPSPHEMAGESGRM